MSRTKSLLKGVVLSGIVVSASLGTTYAQSNLSCSDWNSSKKHKNEMGRKDPSHQIKSTLFVFFHLSGDGNGGLEIVSDVYPAGPKTDSEIIEAVEQYRSNPKFLITTYPATALDVDLAQHKRKDQHGNKVDLARTRIVFAANYPNWKLDSGKQFTTLKGTDVYSPNQGVKAAQFHDLRYCKDASSADADIVMFTDSNTDAKDYELDLHFAIHQKRGSVEIRTPITIDPKVGNDGSGPG
ncbi:MAG: hypothetical protein ACWA5L_02710 [bacterium]